MRHNCNSSKKGWVSPVLLSLSLSGGGAKYIDYIFIKNMERCMYMIYEYKYEKKVQNSIHPSCRNKNN